jgi:hypothetical protein
MPVVRQPPGIPKLLTTEEVWNILDGRGEFGFTEEK